MAYTVQKGCLAQYLRPLCHCPCSAKLHRSLVRSISRYMGILCELVLTKWPKLTVWCMWLASQFLTWPCCRPLFTALSFDQQKMEEETAPIEDETDFFVALWKDQRMILMFVLPCGRIRGWYWCFCCPVEGSEDDIDVFVALWKDQRMILMFVLPCGRIRGWDWRFYCPVEGSQDRIDVCVAQWKDHRMRLTFLLSRGRVIGWDWCLCCPVEGSAHAAGCCLILTARTEIAEHLGADVPLF